MLIYKYIVQVGEFMSGYEQTFEAICEKCNNIFQCNGIVYSSINMDFISNYSDKLRCDQLNRVVCTSCNAEFTYERPFIAYSFKNKYAVIADFRNNDVVCTFGRMHFFDIFDIKDFRFRSVNYLCEVSEKIRIFEAGLDDVTIEIIKIKNFDESYFSDKLNKILVFDKLENNMLYFKLLNDIDEVLECFQLPFDMYLSQTHKMRFNYNNDGQINWYKIDNKSAKELINE